MTAPRGIAGSNRDSVELSGGQLHMRQQVTYVDEVKLCMGQHALSLTTYTLFLTTFNSTGPTYKSHWFLSALDET